MGWTVTWVQFTYAHFELAKAGGDDDDALLLGEYVVHLIELVIAAFILIAWHAIRLEEVDLGF